MATNNVDVVCNGADTLYRGNEKLLSKSLASISLDSPLTKEQPKKQPENTIGIHN